MKLPANSKRFIFGGALLVGLITFFQPNCRRAKQEPVSGTIYDFTVKALDGKRIAVGAIQGKYLLIVNTASKCGYTPQYADLEKLHETLGDKVAILGFPANNFLWQARQ